MKKIVLVMCLLTVFLALPGVSGIGVAATQSTDESYKAAAQASPELKFTVGSKSYLIGETKKTLSVAPFTKDARTLIPIRYVIEAIGGSIEWLQDTKETSITVGSTSILMQVDKATAIVNGVSKPIDSTNPNVMPSIVSGRVFIPLRFVLEAINAEVVWDPGKKAITIRYPKPEPTAFENAKYSINYPSNWVKEADGLNETFSSPEDCGISVLLIDLGTAKTTLDQYVNAYVEGYKKDDSSTKILEKTNFTLSGQDARKLTYTATIDKVAGKFTLGFTIKNNVVYIVLYGGPTGLYPSYTEAMNNAFTSFTLK